MKAEDFKYTYYMTLEEWKKWKVNFDNHYKGEINTKDILDSDRNFERIINSSFVLSKTPEGREYWTEISLRTKPVKQ